MTEALETNAGSPSSGQMEAAYLLGAAVEAEKHKDTAYELSVEQV